MRNRLKFCKSCKTWKDLAGNRCKDCHHLRKQWGVDPGDIFKLKKSGEAYECACCGRSPHSTPSKRLVPYVDQASQQFYGLICSHCTAGFRRFETPTLLQAAMDFLQRGPNPAVRMVPRTTRAIRQTQDLEIVRRAIQDDSLPTLRAKARSIAPLLMLSEDGAMSWIRRTIKKIPPVVVSP